MYIYVLCVYILCIYILCVYIYIYLYILSSPAKLPVSVFSEFVLERIPVSDLQFSTSFLPGGASRFLPVCF